MKAARNVGLSMGQYLGFKNKFAQVSDSGQKSAQKQQTMVQWMRENGFTEAQMGMIRENFKFSGGYSIKWKY